jgi:hypothetical protein
VTLFRATDYRKRILGLLAEKPNLKTHHFYFELAPEDIRAVYRDASIQDSATKKRVENFERQIRRVLFLLARGNFKKRYVGVTYCLDPERTACNGRPVGENLYWLTESGLDHARHLGTIGDKAASRAKTYRTRSRNTTLHDADVTETLLVVEQWCSANARLFYQRVKDIGMRFGDKTLIPDALIQISDPSKAGPSTYNFFVEVEDTKQNDYEDGRSGVVRKCMFYLRYFRTAECNARFGFTDFRALIIVKTERYAVSLLRTLRALMTDGEFSYTDARGIVIPTKKPVRIFWVVTEDDLRSLTNETIFRTPADFDVRGYTLAESV